MNTKYYAGAMLQVPIFGIMLDKLGRKRFLMISAVPIGVGWMLISFGTSLLHIYISRILTGFSAGMLITSISKLKQIREPDLPKHAMPAGFRHHKSDIKKC